MTTPIAVGLMGLAGYGLLRLLMGPHPRQVAGTLATTGLSLLLGATVIGLTTTVVAVVGLHTGPWPFVGPLVAAFAVLALLPARTWPPAHLPRWAAKPTPSEPARTIVADAVVGLATLVIGFGQLWGSWHLAVCCNDEYAIWAIRGRTLSLAGHLDPAVFTGAAANYQHLDYPLLQPALIAWGDGLAGRLDDTSAHVLIISLTLGMLATVGAGLNRLAGPVAGLCAVLLTAGTEQVLAPFGLYLMADIALASLTMAAVVAFALWVGRGDTRWLAVGSALAAGAAATKVEGLLFAIAGMAAVIVVTPPGVRQARRKACLALAAVVVSTLPWQLWTHLHHIQSDLINSRTLSVAHLREVAPYGGLTARLIVDYWPGYGWWGAAAATLAALVALTVPRCRRLVSLLAVTWLLTVFGMWAQYVISAGQTVGPDRLAYALRGHFASSAPRVLIVPSLVLILAIPLLAGAVIWAPAGRPVRRSTPSDDGRPIASAAPARHRMGP